MQYIHLNDDSYILHTSEGMTTLNRKSFNFHRIKKLISEDAEEGEILSLLETPSLPDGLYELYLHPDSDTMAIKHLKDGGSVTWTNLNNENTIINTDNPFVEFIGVYASEQDIMADWPEYCL